MIYNSFMSNQDISLGRIMMGRAAHHVILSRKLVDNSILLGTSDGAITFYKDDKIIERNNFKTFATSMEMNNDKLFISSGDKGLYKYDLLAKQAENLQIPWQEQLKDPLFINKIAGTVMTLSADGSKLWLTIAYNNYGTIFEVDAKTMTILRSFDVRTLFASSYEKISISALVTAGDILYAGTNKGLIEVSLADGQVKQAYGNDILQGKDIKYLRSINDQQLVFCTDYQVYLYTRSTHETKAVYSTHSTEYLRVISAMRTGQDQVYIGTSAGLVILDNSGKLVKDINGAWFKDVDEFGHIRDGGKLIEGDIINIDFINDQEVFLESLHGRVAIFDLKEDKLVSTILVDKPGYINFRWRNYVDLWNNIDFGLYLRNSFIICGLTMLISMLLATITAYALVRFPFPGARTFSVGILATQMIPGVMFLIPIHIMFTNFTRYTGIPIHGTFGGIIFIYSAFFLPFSVWILRSFFAAIPVALEEAATIDGCTPFQVFLKISLPLAIPGVIATGVFVFIVAWDELMFAWILTNAKTMTIPVGIRLFVGNFQNRFDLMMAAATVATVPVMLIFFLLQKYIVSGLTAGAVKE
jgi:multiple sugar transport system permease protein